MTDQDCNKAADFKEEGSKLKRMSAERPVKRAGRRGRKPSKIDQKARLERSRQSARECRARKKLRYQYLEELVLLRERSIFSLREELERLRQWCIQMDNGHIPAGLQEMLMASPPSALQPTSPECYTGSDVRQTLINLQRPEATVSRLPEKTLPLSIPEDFQIPCMPMNCEGVTYVPKSEDYQNMLPQLASTTNTNYLMQMDFGEAEAHDGRIIPLYNGLPFCRQQLSNAVPAFKYSDYQPLHME